MGQIINVECVRILHRRNTSSLWVTYWDICWYGLLFLV